MSKPKDDVENNSENSAFPFVVDEDKAEHMHVSWGLSKRELFAVLLCQGAAASNVNADWNQGNMVAFAVTTADLLIAALEKGNKP